MYFAESENMIIKYEVLIDASALMSLREEIINNCSDITHYRIDDAMDAVRENKVGNEHIRNYQEKITGTCTYGDSSWDIYSVQYDYYEYPGIISYIDAVLDGRYEVVYRIFNPIISEAVENDEIDNAFARKFIREYDYYPLVQKCIALKEVDRVSKDDLESINDFFGSDGALAVMQRLRQ